jgi:hypothetical protein
MPIVDSATMLIPAGLISSSQDFPPLRVERGGLLGTGEWVIAMVTPPAASALFTLSISTTQLGAFGDIVARFTWPAGTAGSRHVPVGVSGRLAQLLNNQAAWVRASVTLSGPLVLAGSWLTKPSDGGPGLGSRPNAVFTGVAS